MILLLIILINLTYLLADLPVHCLHKQVLGIWEFNREDYSGDNTLSCGYSQPDTSINHFIGYKYEIKIKDTIKIELKAPNIAKLIDSEIEGTWTMVYDEGFEVKINEQVYFAFFAYEPKDASSLKNIKVENYISYCSQSLIGWYHTKDNKKWGCYQSQKVGEKAFRLPIYQAKDSNGKEITVSQDPNAILSPVKLLEMGASVSVEVELETERASTNMQMFVANTAFVDMINTQGTYSWQARVPVEFEGKSMTEVNKMRGHSKLHKADHLRKSLRDVKSGKGIGWSKKTSMFFGDDDKAILKENDLPESWDWRSIDVDGTKTNYISPVKNQGSCGSCFAVAGVQTAEDRLRIKTKNKNQSILSVSEVVACSRINQGCSGGYPYLVAKHAAEQGLLPEEALPYSTTAKCEEVKKSSIKYQGNYDYHYVGGYYGGCNELEMMKELYHNGPIMVALYIPSSFFYYKSGVFHFDRSQPGREPNIEDNWEEVSHAVSCVGYGVDYENKVDGKPVKYWIIRNTWGPAWGDNGFVKIARGIDECASESMTVAFNLDIASN